MNLDHENARLSICSLLDLWSSMPTADRTLRSGLLESIWDAEPRLPLRSLHQVGQDFVLTVQVPEGDDAEEYCAAVEALIDYPRLTVEPYEHKWSDDDLSEFGKRTRYIHSSTVGSGKSLVIIDELFPGVPAWVGSRVVGKRVKLPPPAAHGPARKGKAGKAARW